MERDEAWENQDRILVEIQPAYLHIFTPGLYVGNGVEAMWISLNYTQMTIVAVVSG